MSRPTAALLEGGVTPLVNPLELAKPELPDLPEPDLLLIYQRKAIDLFSTTALLVIEKSRRIGLTWGMAAFAALTAATEKSAGGDHVWYMGIEMEMAREFIDAVAMWAEAFGIAAEAEGQVVLRDPDGDIQAFRIRFASGFRVTAIPSLPRALRGRQGVVIIDEAAFHKSIDEVLKAALALLMWGGRVVVISTHDGVDNPFNQLIEEVREGKRGDAKSLRISFQDAMDAGLYERIMLVKGQPATPEGKVKWEAGIRAFYGDAAEEELDCIPRAGGGAWLDAGLLAACEHEDAGKPELYQGGLTYIGRDVARRKDFAVIWAFEMINGVLWLRERYEAVGDTFAEQDRKFDAMMAKYRVAKAKIDQTGMGEKVVEDAQTRHGSLRVEGVVFSGPARLDLAVSLREVVEAGQIRFPPDPAIRADFRAIKRAGKNQAALAEKGEVHPDRFWAAALAASAAKAAVVDLSTIQVAARGRDGFDGFNPSAGFGGGVGFGGGLDTRGF
jgi:phage FluMu gp28-like protein